MDKWLQKAPKSPASIARVSNAYYSVWIILIWAIGLTQQEAIPSIHKKTGLCPKELSKIHYRGNSRGRGGKQRLGRAGELCPF